MANARADKPYRLTALGRLPASTRDGMGDTLGSFSGMALSELSIARIIQRARAVVNRIPISILGNLPMI